MIDAKPMPNWAWKAPSHRNKKMGVLPRRGGAKESDPPWGDERLTLMDKFPSEYISRGIFQNEKYLEWWLSMELLL